MVKSTFTTSNITYIFKFYIGTFLDNHWHLNKQQWQQAWDSEVRVLSLATYGKTVEICRNTEWMGGTKQACTLCHGTQTTHTHTHTYLQQHP